MNWSTDSEFNKKKHLLITTSSEYQSFVTFVTPKVFLAGGRSNLERLITYFQKQIDVGVIRQELSAEALAIAFDSLFSSSVLFEYVFQDSLTPRKTIDELAKPLAGLFARGTMRANINR